MEKKENIIALSTAYLPNIQYFAKILQSEKIILEQYENYIKQTYRNRCEIFSANGIKSLIIPVKHTGTKQLIKDIKIDYSGNWQKLHWKTINSAYMSSPFFEYYIDDFSPFYEKKETFLFDFNYKLIVLLLELIGIKNQISVSDSYNIYDATIDHRTTITPKNKSNDFNPVPYFQVFSHKCGFAPNLSILDLLCNEGNNTYSLLVS